MDRDAAEDAVRPGFNEVALPDAKIGQKSSGTSSHTAGNPYPFTTPPVFGICLPYACHMTMSGISFGSLSYPCHNQTQKRYTCHILILKKI